MKKRFKPKKKYKFNLLIFVLIIILLIIFIKIYMSKFKLINSNTVALNGILENTTIVYKNKILNNIFSYINNIFNKPVIILESQLKYKEKNEVDIISFLYKENKNPDIYIYNSHQGEKYSYEYLEKYNIVPDVLIASSMLKEKLQNKNINVIMDGNNLLEYMKLNNLEHADSYIASRHFLENIVNKYKSIKLFIDIHRDAATHEITTVTINNKPCAKILFVIGLEYDTYQNNLKTTEDINNLILAKYPSLTRGIMKKEGYGVNGVYNQDLNSKIILLEVGGNENNIEEVNNTLDIIAEILGEYLNEKEK